MWTLHHANEKLEIAVNGRFTLNSVGMIHRLATLDLGITLLPAAVVVEDVVNGRLQPILPDWHGIPVLVLCLDRNPTVYRVSARTLGYKCLKCCASILLSSAIKRLPIANAKFTGTALPVRHVFRARGFGLAHR